MTKIAIILGSTRPGRHAEQVAGWVLEQASKRGDAEFELLDVADFELPLLDEAVPPSMGRYEHEHTKRWAAAIEPFDGFIFVTPEYNHSTSGALKNAIDFIYGEWNNKVAALVGYGMIGGARAIEHLRLILAEVQIATVRQTLTFSLVTDFEDFSTFKPGDHQLEPLGTMLDQLVSWTKALEGVRKGGAATA